MNDIIAVPSVDGVGAYKRSQKLYGAYCKRRQGSTHVPTLIALAVVSILFVVVMYA